MPVLLENTLFNRTLSIRPLLWPDLAEGRLRLDRLAATPPDDFLPLGYAHSSRDKKLARLASFATLRPACRCVANRLRPVDRHRGRDGRGLENSEQGELLWLTLAHSRNPATSSRAKS